MSDQRRDISGWIQKGLMGGKDSPLDGQPLPVAAQIYRSLLLPGQRNHGYGPSPPWTIDKLFFRNSLGLQRKIGTLEAFSLMICAETRLQNADSHCWTTQSLRCQSNRSPLHTHTHNSICSLPLESPVYIPTCTLRGTMANHMLSVCQMLSPVTEEFRALFKC